MWGAAASPKWVIFLLHGRCPFPEAGATPLPMRWPGLAPMSLQGPIHPSTWRDCLENQDKSLLDSRECSKWGQEALICHLRWHQLHTLQSLLEIFQRLSLEEEFSEVRCSKRKPVSVLESCSAET